MNEGEAMPEVTEADRTKAWQVLCALPISIPGYSPETVRKAQDHLAAALAEEREKARAPFLALVSEYSGEALSEHFGGHTTAGDILRDIQRAAEESK